MMSRSEAKLPEAVAALPIAGLLPQMVAALEASLALVVQAPPGAGKTTAVPLALLAAARAGQADWLADKTIVMLEPRRLAARAAAARMADLLGEPVGQTVGYRIRQDSRVSAQTRIEVVTEGILTRRLVQSPDLPDVGVVIFDEFHERSLNADLGLALCLETQSALRDDLRLLVMSATLDAAPVAALIGRSLAAEVPILTSAGRAFPVEVRYCPSSVSPSRAGLRAGPRSGQGPRFEDSVAAVVRSALTEESGSLLVFLPGEREIRRTQTVLQDLLPPSLAATVDVRPLYGSLPVAAQDAALRPSPPARRKVVLSTSLAETSLTIEGVRVVIDSGWARRASFDPASGMSRLITTRVSRAEAEQRRGRAGRLEAGVCYRLWSPAEDLGLAAFPPPEILQADLCGLALDLAAWGSRESDLLWLEPPPAGALAQARDLLQQLGALSAQHQITAHGQRLSRWPLHPRLAQMIERGKERGQAALACVLAAVLSERDPLRGAVGRGAVGREADLRLRVEAVAGVGRSEPAVARARSLAEDWLRRCRTAETLSTALSTGGSMGVACGEVLALAYPDRVARRRASGSYTLSNGRGAVLAEGDPLAAEEALVVAELTSGSGATPAGQSSANSQIRLAAPLVLSVLDELFADQIMTHDLIGWDRQDEVVLARRQRRFAALVLRDERLTAPDPQAVAAALMEGVRQGGLHVLPWDRQTTQLRARLAFVRHAAIRQAERRQAETPPEESRWPDVSDNGLLARLEDWLLPFALGMTRLTQLKKVPLAEALLSELGWAQRQELDRLAPTHFVVPTGDAVPLDYEASDVPVLAVRVQQMFGLMQHPSLADGAVPLVVHLLSPAHRPLQVTQDLPGFWTSSYPAVRSEMRGRYPKHPWPEDPRAALPTNRRKPPGT